MTFMLNVTSIQKIPTESHRSMGFITVPIPTPYTHTHGNSHGIYIPTAALQEMPHEFHQKVL